MVNKYEKGSFTVETSLVMPVILACIFLIFVMNIYLHDQVALDSLVTEMVHSGTDSGKVETEFESAVAGRTLLIKKVSCTYKTSLNKKNLKWTKSMELPISSFLKLVVGTPQISLKGSSSSSGWNMTEIMRLKQILSKGGV